MNVYLLSISTSDQTGLVAAVTGGLFEHGANCGDTNFTILGQGAELNCVFTLPTDIDVNDIKEHLEQLPEMSDADISVKAFSHSTEHKTSASVTHTIMIQGGDHQGLLAQLSEEFIQFEGNIVRLNSKQIPGTNGMQYHIEMSVYIPKSREQACLATINNTASSLQLNCDIHSQSD